MCGLMSPSGWAYCQRRPGRWLTKRSKKLYRAAQLIFPFSPGMARQIKAHGVPSPKIYVTPNGSDTRCNPHQASFTPAVKVLYLGTIGIANDLSQLVRAIHLIQERGIRRSSVPS